MIAIDSACSEWFNAEDGCYHLPKRGIVMTREQMVDMYADFVEKYPIISLEDGMAEDDWEGWKMLMDRLGKKIQLVGDDLFVTNVQRIKKGHRARRRQCRAHQAQPDRHPDRDARRYPDGAPRRLDGRRLAPIQLNYLDWTLQNAKKKCVRKFFKAHGLPVWVMEPVRGGRLAKLDDETEAAMRAARPDESTPAWAFRWLQTVPQPTMVRSGMTSLAQMQDNIKTFSEEKAAQR